MANKMGVGIWKHYKTNESPRADGLETSFSRGKWHYRCKFYWAPADFTNPNKSGRRMYLVIQFVTGKMDRYGRYDTELRTAGYVGDAQYRRNYKMLCDKAAQIDEDKLVALTEDTLLWHEQMLAHGCTFERGCYYFPQGSDSAEIRKQVEKAIKAIKEAR